MKKQAGQAIDASGRERAPSRGLPGMLGGLMGPWESSQLGRRIGSHVLKAEIVATSKK